MPRNYVDKHELKAAVERSIEAGELQADLYRLVMRCGSGLLSGRQYCGIAEHERDEILGRAVIKVSERLELLGTNAALTRICSIVRCEAKGFFRSKRRRIVRREMAALDGEWVKGAAAVDGRRWAELNGFVAERLEEWRAAGCAAKPEEVAACVLHGIVEQFEGVPDGAGSVMVDCDGGL